MPGKAFSPTGDGRPPGYFETMGMQLRPADPSSSKTTAAHPSSPWSTNSWPIAPGPTKIHRQAPPDHAIRRLNATRHKPRDAQVIGLLKHPRVHDLTRDVREQIYISQFSIPTVRSD